MSTLRVVSLQAQNIMRLTAVEIVWDPAESTLKVGGKNGAGKSSVLNAVAMALGGKALCPEEPIRQGEESGFVQVDLGEFVVRRDFSRDKHFTCAIEGDNVNHQHTPDCVFTWGETKSSLTLRNAEGIKQGTPQAILDRLIGKLSFDPLAFANEEPARQDAILRQIVGLDVSAFEEQRKVAYDRRAHWKKEYTAGTARLQAMPTYKDAPSEEIPMAEISDEMLKAEEYRRLAVEADRATDKAHDALTNLEKQSAELSGRIAETEKRLATMREEMVSMTAKREDAVKEHEARKITAESAHAVVPDSAAIRQRLTDAEAINAKVRANAAYAAEAKKVDEFGAKAKAEDEAVKAAEKAKEDALQAVKFPVEGLGVNDNGVTFNGIPFKQASTAEQIKVSVEVGFALNQGVKLLLVRNGNALDEDSLKAVAAQAEAAGGQILMEYVTKNADDVSVMIVDGHNA